MGQITYRGQPDDVMNQDLQPIQRVGANLIRRSGLAPLFVECVLQELEDTMKPPVEHGPRPAAPPAWDEMFKRMHSELKPGFVREDGTTTSQPIVAMCYLLGDGGLDGGSLPNPLPVEGRGEPERRHVRRLIPLLRHPAIVPRIYVALALGRMEAREALAPLIEMIREDYPFSDSVAMASGKHFDQSQNVRWRGFLCLALGRMGGDDARKALEEFAANPQEPRDIRFCAVAGLGFIGSPDSLPVLEQVASDDIIWLVRDAARQIARNIQLTQLEARR
jgi:HEAT repeat protein